MRKLLAVIKREFKATAANKTFIITTILGPFLILAITVLPGMLTSNPQIASSGKPLAVYTSHAFVYDRLIQVMGAQNIPLFRAEDLAQGKEGVLSETYAGLIEIPENWPREEARFYSATGMEAVLFTMTSEVLSTIAVEVHAQELGINPEITQKLLSRPAFRVVKLNSNQKEETKTSDDFIGILLTALSFVMMIYMTVLLYGQLIGRSVVQEKTSKTVEIMLSSLSSRELMFGKILGLGFAGLLQYGVWIGMGIVMIRLVGPRFNISLPPALNISNLLWLVLFFVLAFFLYGACYAAFGAAAEDEHHLGQLAWPLIFFLIIPMVMISPMIMNPKIPFVVGLSFFPMTAPIVMLVRILVKSVSVGEILISLGLIGAAIMGAVYLGAKIFRTGILMTGKRHTISEVLRWIRTK